VSFSFSSTDETLDVDIPDAADDWNKLNRRSSLFNLNADYGVWDERTYKTAREIKPILENTQEVLGDVVPVIHQYLAYNRIVNGYDPIRNRELGGGERALEAGLEFLPGVVGAAADRLKPLARFLRHADEAVEISDNAMDVVRSTSRNADNLRSTSRSLNKLGDAVDNVDNGLARQADGFAQPKVAKVDVPKVHKNSRAYQGESHVYVIKAPDGSVHKVGKSSAGKRLSDGASKRAEAQVRKLNDAENAAGRLGGPVEQ
jgi:hypothetical protein